MDNLTIAIRELSNTLNNPTSANLSEWVYVIATILICIFNFRSAKATREQVQEQKRQFDEINRPNIDITFEVIRGGLACLKIENTGKKSANTVRQCSHEILAQSNIQRILTAAMNDLTFLAYLVAMPRHCFKWRKAFSTK